MENLIQEALDFAKKKHKDQSRKFAEEPYFNHPKRVSEIVKKFKQSHKIQELIAAALLHDTLEDTDTNIKELKEKFGELITSLVIQLTTDEEEKEEKGKLKYLSEKLSDPKKVSSWALVIKLADRLDNVSDPKKVPEEFVDKYVKETREIIKSLEDNRKLSETQLKLINEIKKELKELE